MHDVASRIRFFSPGNPDVVKESIEHEVGHTAQLEGPSPQLQQTSVDRDASVVPDETVGRPCAVAREVVDSGISLQPALSLFSRPPTLKILESSNTEAVHNDSPDGSPAEDEADDHEPNATDKGVRQTLGQWRTERKLGTMAMIRGKLWRLFFLV